MGEVARSRGPSFAMTFRSVDPHAGCQVGRRLFPNAGAGGRRTLLRTHAT